MAFRKEDFDDARPADQSAIRIEMQKGPQQMVYHHGCPFTVEKGDDGDDGEEPTISLYTLTGAATGYVRIDLTSEVARQLAKDLTILLDSPGAAVIKHRDPDDA